MNRSELIATMLENMNLMKRGMTGMVQQLMRDLPVSPSQLELLYMVDSLQPVSAKELAKNRHLTPGAVSQLLDILAEQALITRKAVDKDRRTYLLHTTESGDQLLQTVKTRRTELFRRAMRNLTDEELALWLKVQQKLIHEFEQSNGEDSKQKGSA